MTESSTFQKEVDQYRRLGVESDKPLDRKALLEELQRKKNLNLEGGKPTFTLSNPEDGITTGDLIQVQDLVEINYEPLGSAEHTREVFLKTSKNLAINLDATKAPGKEEAPKEYKPGMRLTLYVDDFKMVELPNGVKDVVISGVKSKDLLLQYLTAKRAQVQLEQRKLSAANLEKIEAGRRKFAEQQRQLLVQKKQEQARLIMESIKSLPAEEIESFVQLLERSVEQVSQQPSLSSEPTAPLEQASQNPDLEA